MEAHALLGQPGNDVDGVAAMVTVMEECTHGQREIGKKGHIIRVYA